MLGELDYLTKLRKTFEKSAGVQFRPALNAFTVRHITRVFAFRELGQWLVDVLAVHGEIHAELFSQLVELGRRNKQRIELVLI